MNASLKNVGWGLKLGHARRSKISDVYVIKKRWLSVSDNQFFWLSDTKLTASGYVLTLMKWMSYKWPEILKKISSETYNKDEH